MQLRRFQRPKPDHAWFTLGVVGASKVVKDPRWPIDVLRHLRRHDERYRLLLLRGKLQDSAPGAKEYAAALRRDLDELEPSGAVQVLSHTDDVSAALEQVGVEVWRRHGAGAAAYVIEGWDWRVVREEFEQLFRTDYR